MFPHQDFNDVIFKKPILKRSVCINPKNNDEDDENYSKVPLHIGLLIQQRRIALGMKQCDLAKQINVKPDVIQNLENCKHVPDNNILQKLRKILKCKITI